MAIKRRLSEQEEFEIMKLVFDKFLWLGAAFAGWGLYISIAQDFSEGIWYIVAGAAFMIIFAYIIIKEFDHMR